jgi:hypothetical protein
MKHTVNAMVLTMSTDHAWRGMGVGVVAMEKLALGLARLSADRVAVNIHTLARGGAAEERWPDVGSIVPKNYGGGLRFRI